MTDLLPTDFYIGLREAVIAEVGTLDCYEGKYLIQPTGDAQWDAEGFKTKKEAKEALTHYREWAPARVCWL